MKLFGASGSPYVRKVLAFADEKGIELELVPVGFGDAPPEFYQASPFKKMPAFQDGDFMISDSSAIIAYLDALKPEPNLIPLEPRARARVIWFEEYADTIITPPAAKMVFNRLLAPRLLNRPGDEAVAAAAEADELPPVIAYLESVIPASGWLVEDRPTLADISVASPLGTLMHTGWRLDPDKYPKAAAYVEKVLARPCLARWIEQERAFFAS